MANVEGGLTLVSDTEPLRLSHDAAETATVPFVVTVGGDLTVTPDGGTFAIGGELTVSGALGVAGAATLGSLGVTAAATVGGTLAVTGLSTLASLSVTAGATVGGTLGVTGAATLASVGVTGNATVGGTLGVTGLSTLGSLAVTAGATVGGTFGVTGAATLNSTLSVAGLVSLPSGGYHLLGTNALATAVGVVINSAAAQTRDLVFRTAGVNRWFLRTDSSAESGANAGSNLVVLARDDAGNAIGTALSITRSTMLAAFGGAVTVTGSLTVSGALSVTSAGPHAVGAGAPVDYVGFLHAGSLNSGGGSTIAVGTRFQRDIVGAAGDTTYIAQVQVAGTITVQAGEAVSVVAGAFFREPNITLLAGASAPIAVTAYIEGAPTEGAVNLALLVDSGDSRFDGGVMVGAPTGGFKGAGTINAVAVYDDNVLLTDWLFDLAYDGHTSLRVPAGHGRLFTLSQARDVAVEQRRLPWMPTRADFEADRNLGGMVSRLWQGQEQQQLYIQELEDRIAQLERNVELIHA